jgi:hypothetical protein
MGRLRPYVFDSIPRTHTLIETGTNTGIGVLHCRKLFRAIHTIELEPQVQAAAAKKLARWKHITCHCGPSPDILGTIIDPWRSTTFFLDAHYTASADGRFGFVADQCPLVAELETIFAFQWAEPCYIIIDDLRMYCHWFWTRPQYAKWAAFYDQKQWPNLEQLVALAEKNGLKALPHFERDMLYLVPK